MRYIVLLVLIGCRVDANDLVSMNGDAEAAVRITRGGMPLQDAAPAALRDALLLKDDGGVDLRSDAEALGATDVQMRAQAEVGPAPGRPLGAACSAADQCDSGFCVGAPGRCCNQACDGACQACGTGYCENANEGLPCAPSTCDGKLNSQPNGGLYAPNPPAHTVTNSFCRVGSCVQITTLCADGARYCVNEYEKKNMVFVSGNDTRCVFYTQYHASCGGGSNWVFETCANGVICSVPGTSAIRSGMCK